jgi:phasin family protein
MATKAKSEKAIEKHTQPFEAVIGVGKQTVENAMKVGTEMATKHYEKALAMTQEQMEKATSAAFVSYDEMTTFGKDNIDAMVKASNVLVKGFESLGKEVATYGQSSIERNVSNTQALFGAKTLREFLDLQAEIAKSSFDSWVEESTKLGELGAKFVNEVLEPIQEQVSVAVEKMMKPAAA